MTNISCYFIANLEEMWQNYIGGLILKIPIPKLILQFLCLHVYYILNLLVVYMSAKEVCPNASLYTKGRLFKITLD
jgi:hypothetical protein